MMASDHQLSAYESRRAQNIVRNNKRLRELGLISTLEEERSNAAAWGVFSEKVISEEDQTADWKPAGSGETTATSSKRKRRAVSEKRHIKSPARKSARLQGIGPEGGDAHNLTEEERSKERQAMIQECREARQRAAAY
ncbi:hypothetical protein IV203_009743 [Nitzschia inconspicua]|uniref:Uncharacterized protein n=1 Tax=Nitzschia inconspicua TaxID=303405 RepID=A0A9K3PKB5_9STRA|nr:hypothetical protein IV203_009743 [Nitzschia inconspicua]